RQDAVDALLHRHPKGVVDVQEDDGLRRLAGGLEDRLLIGKGVAENHPRRWEVAKHKFVALLGDGWRRGDVDYEGDALLLGHLGNRRGLARVEGADEQLRALANQALGPRARGVDVGFGIPVHDAERRQTAILKDTRGDLDPALTVLTNAGLHTGAWQ